LIGSSAGDEMEGNLRFEPGDLRLVGGWRFRIKHEANEKESFWERKRVFWGGRDIGFPERVARGVGKDVKVFFSATEDPQEIASALLYTGLRGPRNDGRGDPGMLSLAPCNECGRGDLFALASGP